MGLSSIGENKNRGEMERILEEYRIRDYQIYEKDGESYIGFSKKVTPQPSSELEDDIYDEILKLRFPNQSNIELRQIDVNPEDMPSGTVFEYFWYVRTSYRKVVKTLKEIGKIEKKYANTIEGLVNIYIEEGKVELDKLFDLLNN